jgi:hypothetical protein
VHDDEAADAEEYVDSGGSQLEPVAERRVSAFAQRLLRVEYHNGESRNEPQ